MNKSGLLWMSWVCVCACSVSGLGHGFHLQITPITPAARDKKPLVPRKDWSRKCAGFLSKLYFNAIETSDGKSGQCS